MHFRNGRPAANGDKIVRLAAKSDGTGVVIDAVGVLIDAKPGNSHCNGSIVPLLGGAVTYACLCDCIHFDDLSDALTEKGWDKRPPGL